MSKPRPSPPQQKPRRPLQDALATIAGASFATLCIIFLMGRPIHLCVALLVLCALFLKRWHGPRDIAGFLVGATMGNLTEVACDLKGIWIHVWPQLFASVPVYILICYPILGLALPPLVDAVLRKQRPLSEGGPRVIPWALGLWAVHVLLSMRYGTDNDAELIASILCLVATLARFHSPHDLGFAAVGTALALVWELPCTAFSAWHFAAPQLAGLIPFWLPFAYALFFINMGRATISLARLLRGSA